jgi:Protein of unknown function (DUF4239)
MLVLKLVVVIVAALVLVLGTREVLRRKLPPTDLEHAEKAVPFLLGSISGFYGLITGFMLSNSYAELRSLHGAVTSEINALAELDRVARQLPQPASGELQRGVDGYLRSVVRSELPLMAQGRVSAQTTQALDQLWHVLGQFRPQSEWDTSMRNLALSGVVDLGDQRRKRILASRDRMPLLIWWILLGGGVIVVSGACLASLQHRRPAGLFLGALSAIVTLVLFVILALQQPFKYGVATGAGDYALLWESLRGRPLDRADSAVTLPRTPAPR